MIEKIQAEPVTVDPSASFSGHRIVQNGDSLTAARLAYNEVAQRVNEAGRSAAMIEVVVRVLP